MTVAELSLAYNGRQRAIAGRVEQAAAVLWSHVDRHNVGDSWMRLLPNLVTITRAGKTAAATGATAYVTESLREQGATSDPVGQVVPAAFAQSAADGRALGSLLYLPVLDVQRQWPGQGVSIEKALASASSTLQMIVRSEVADAGRQSVAAAITADRRTRGYYREVGSGACARCAILAGKWFSTAEAASFERHPRCQCTAVAAPDRGRGNPTGYSPKGYFDGLTRTQQDQIFTKTGAQAIRDGADMSQVVNARSGMSSIRDFTTSTGTTRHGLFGGHTAAGRAGKARLSPQGVYAVSATRDEAIERLKANGYIL